MYPSPTPEPAGLPSTLRRLIGSGHAGFDRIVRELQDATGADIGCLLLSDGEHPRPAARVGAAIEPIVDRFAFHRYAMAQSTLRVDDATGDWRFRYHPLVLCEPFIRAYAGQAVRVGGRPVGVLCALASKPGAFAGLDPDLLSALAAQVEIILAAECAPAASAQVLHGQPSDKAPQVYIK